MNYNDFDKTAAYGKLSALAKTWKFDFVSKLDADRVKNCVAPMAGGLSYS
jgi:hypothetical protein